MRDRELAMVTAPSFGFAGSADSLKIPTSVDAVDVNHEMLQRKPLTTPATWCIMTIPANG
jgi:hypothetical protein